MSKLLKALLEKKQAVLVASQAITKKAGDEARELTAEESATINANLATIESLNTQIAAERALIEAARTIDLPGASVIVSTEDNGAKTHGFNAFGEFLGAIVNAGRQGGSVDPRLNYKGAAPSTYGNENVGQDGGFLVPIEYATEIARHSLEDDSLLARCDDTPVSGNSMTFPSDETTPWGTDGVRMYWDGEADTATPTKPKIKPNTMRLSKLMGLIPLTDELIEDVAALPVYVEEKAASGIRYKCNDALLNGTGAGMPAGLLNAAALVTVTKESGQAAATFKAENAAKMFARMPAEYLGGAVWVINQDVLPQLLTMTIGNQPIWTPPNAGLKEAPGGMLLGKPIIPSQGCQTLGTKGDVFFANFKQYRTISKRGGVQIAQSMHLYFDAGLTAIRITFRLDGQPKFKQAISPAKGSNSLSPYVVIENR